MPYCEITGQLLLTETRINFAAEEKNYKYLMVGTMQKKCNPF
jgi:hypothetical protein